MGGNVPLGYDASDRALVINPPSEDEIADVGVRSRLSAGGSRIRTAGPSRNRVGLSLGDRRRMQPERAFLSSPQSGIHFVPVKTSNFSGGTRRRF